MAPPSCTGFELLLIIFTKILDSEKKKSELSVLFFSFFFFLNNLMVSFQIQQIQQRKRKDIKIVKAN